METTTTDETNQRHKLGLAFMLATAVAVACLFALVASAVFAGGLVLRPRQLQEEQAADAQSSKSGADSVQAPSAPTPAARSDKPERALESVPTATTERQLRVFRQLWNIVNDHYVYPDFNGYDWKKAKTDTEARIKAGMADPKFYDLMSELITNLNDNHSSYLSPQDAKAEDEAYKGKKEYVGIGVLVDSNKDKKYVYILQVYPGSPADEAGLKPHDHILEIDGTPSVDADGVEHDELMRGPVDTSVTLTVRTPGSEPRAVTITRASVNSSEPVVFRILPGKKRIGYMLVPTLFEDTIGEQMRDGLKALMKESGGKLDGLIVDMRINGGGAYPILNSALGFFTRGNMGKLVDREQTLYAINVRAEKIGNSQTVPLVVLVGPATESYAEVFAGSLQGKGRAKLIGLPSAGNIETLLRHDFEDGSVAWVAEETFQLPNGSGWEGVGLQPDVRVTAGWDEFTDANDPGIAAAVKVISK